LLLLCLNDCHSLDLCIPVDSVKNFVVLHVSQSIAALHIMSVPFADCDDANTDADVDDDNDYVDDAGVVEAMFIPGHMSGDDCSKDRHSTPQLY
jgi:hypothetical protein